MPLSFTLAALSLSAADCAYDSRGFAYRDRLETEYYDVIGGNVRLVLDMLRTGPKPFSALGPDTVGAHETKWNVTFSYRLDAEERVEKACMTVDYTIHLPRFTDPAMARCLRDLVDDTRRHEERHHDLTRPLVELAAPKLIGMRRDEVDPFLNDLTRRINEANTLFHNSAAGQPVYLSRALLDRCPQ